MSRIILNDIVKDISVYQKNEGNFSTIVYSRVVSFATDPETATDTVQNLTGFTAKMRIKATEQSTSALFEVTGTVSTPANGTITFTTTAAQNTIDEGTYYYEIIIYKATNVNYSTVNKGRYIVLKSLF